MFKNEYLLLFAILLFAGLVRLYKLDNPVADWHSWRQADTVSVSKIYLDDGIDIFTPRYYDVSSIQTGSYNPNGLRFVEFPIYNAINAMLAKQLPLRYPDILLSKRWKNIGYSPSSVELWGRLLSIIASLGSCLFLYFIGKNIYNKKVGLLSAFFFAIIPYSIYYSRVILPEPLAVFTALGGVYFFLKFVSKESKWFLYLSGLFFALSLLIKPFSAFYLIPLGYLAIHKFGFKSFFKYPNLLIRHLVFLNIALIPFFAWRIWINNSPIGIPHFSWAFNGDGIRFKPAFWRWIFAERIGNLILGVWGVVLIVFGLISKTIKFPYFIHFFALATVMYMTVFATANVRHDYYQTFVVPALALILAVGVFNMWNTDSFNKTTIRIVAGFCIFIMLVSGWIQVKEDYAVNHPEIVEAGIAVDKLVPKNSRVIAPYLGDTAFLYQTKRYGWPVADTSFDTLISRGAQYYVSVNFADPDTNTLLKKYETLAKTSSYIIINLTKPIK